MDIRKIAPDYAVSPQIAPGDVADIAAAGYDTILCNRPDAEVPPDLSSAAIRQAAEAAGLTFVDNPITHQGLDAGMVARQRQAIETATDATLAYCASGTRSTIVWALGQSGQRPAEDIVRMAADAGYDISGLAPRL